MLRSTVVYHAALVDAMVCRKGMVCIHSTEHSKGHTHKPMLSFFLNLPPTPYHDPPTGRPLSPRDIFIVQDYVLMQGGTQNAWFYTYNEDLDHVRLFVCLG